MSICFHFKFSVTFANMKMGLIPGKGVRATHVLNYFITTAVHRYDAGLAVPQFRFLVSDVAAKFSKNFLIMFAGERGARQHKLIINSFSTDEQNYEINFGFRPRACDFLLVGFVFVSVLERLYSCALIVA